MHLYLKQKVNEIISNTYKLKLLKTEQETNFF